MDTEKFVKLIKDTFPEDVIETMATFYWAHVNSKSKEVGGPKVTDYFLTGDGSKIVRIDSSDRIGVREVEPLHVYIDIVGKLTMEPLVRLKNPKSMELINGIFRLNVDNTQAEINKEVDGFLPIYDYKEIVVNPIINHILIYRSSSKMSKNDIRNVPFPTRAYKDNKTIFSSLEIFRGVKELPEIRDFLSKEWSIDPSYYAISNLGYGQEGCIIKNESSRENIVVTVNLDDDIPKATIILPNGKVHTRSLVDLSASKKYKVAKANICLAFDRREVRLISDRAVNSINYFYKNDQHPVVNIGNAIVDLHEGTIIAI